MRDLSLPQQLQLGQHFEQARIRRDAALVGAADVVARAEPSFRVGAKHCFGRVPQNLIPGVPQQQLQPWTVRVHQTAGALQMAARPSRGLLRRVQLHGHGQEQMPGVGVRAVQQLAGTVLRRVKELGAGLVDIGILRHGADRSAKRYQEVSCG